MPNLTGPRITVESRFDTTCRIDRDLEGHLDDILDETTLLLTPPTADAELVYQGRSMIRPAATGSTRPGSSSSSEQGSQIQYLNIYRARIPADAPAVQIGDRYTVLNCDSDPTMNGSELTVIGITGGTYSVSRILTLQGRQRGPRL